MKKKEVIIGGKFSLISIHLKLSLKNSPLINQISNIYLINQVTTKIS